MQAQRPPLASFDVWILALVGKGGGEQPGGAAAFEIRNRAARLIEREVDQKVATENQVGSREVAVDEITEHERALCVSELLSVSVDQFGDDVHADVVLHYERDMLHPEQVAARCVEHGLDAMALEEQREFGAHKLSLREVGPRA